jgi:sulfide dehydrogenase [flavocytochrome c] flavoprotein subunit
MQNLTRRDFLCTSAAGLVALALPLSLKAQEKARIVIVGGGFGGATCAKYLRRLNPHLQVTVIERDSVYITCPFSNQVVTGLRSMADISYRYDGLKAHDVEISHDNADAIDPVGRKIMLSGGSTLPYDRLVLAAGADLRWDAVEGYDEAASELLPHAWQAGPQTELLQRQLQALDDGGTVIITVPAEPYRCPPAPYERASLIAHYLKNHKPKSKILILDTKDKFPKQELFMQGWEQLYPGMIEWIAGSDGGIVDSVDAGTRTLYTESGFTEHQADVINFIPPQYAAAIARRTGLVDITGWCPIDQLTFESSLQPGIHILGDAAIAGSMPKSAFSASNQAKICAAAIITALAGESLPQPSYAHTCYSLLAPDYAISISAVYRLTDGELYSVDGAGGLSPTDAPAEFRAREAQYNQGWYASITSDTFG